MNFVTDFWWGTNGEWADASESPVVKATKGIVSSIFEDNGHSVPDLPENPDNNFSSPSDTGNMSEFRITIPLRVSTMIEPALAIDFGTSCTKVAWRDRDGSIHFLHFNGKPYLSSLFYLPIGSSEILLGHEAQIAYEDDPLGAVIGLKNIIEYGTSIRTTKDRKIDSLDLLIYLFHAINHQLVSNNAFGGKYPEKICFTVPNRASEKIKNQLEQAAQAIGWKNENNVKVFVQFELVTAAQNWFFGEGYCKAQGDMLVVIDCGGGTTDWALMQRTGNRIHNAEYFVPGTVKHGGIDIDRALSDWVRTHHPELYAVRSERCLREQLRVWKEAMFSGAKPPPFRIKGQKLGLDEAVLAQEFKRVLLDEVLPDLEKFLEPIVTQYPDVPVLLVGGSATGLLEKAIKGIHPLIHRNQDSIGAEIRGALITAAVRTHEQEQTIWVAIFGKINVGKSAIVNSLLGDDLAPVGVRHVTNHPITLYKKDQWVIVDTPGILGSEALESLALEEVRKAHAIVFVVSEEPFKGELDSFDLIAQALPDTPKIVFCNKYDELQFIPPNFRDIVQAKIKQKMGKYVGDKGNNIIFGNAMIYNKETGNMERKPLLELLDCLNELLK